MKEGSHKKQAEDRWSASDRSATHAAMDSTDRFACAPANRETMFYRTRTMPGDPKKMFAANMQARGFFLLRSLLPRQLR